jgi:hypothetical protein
MTFMVRGVYKGDMKIGKIHGEGTWTADGDRFDGAFENGKIVWCLENWTFANGHQYRSTQAFQNARHLEAAPQWGYNVSRLKGQSKGRLMMNVETTPIPHQTSGDFISR